MKKRILALMMCGVLVLGGSTVAFAEAEAAEEEVEEGDTIKLTWEDMDDEFYEAATWINCFDVFDIMLPNNWDVLANVDLEEGEPEDGVYFAAQDPENGMTVAVNYADGEGQVDYANLAEGLEGEGFEDFQMWELNELPCLYYYNDDVCAISSIDDQGGVYTVILAIPDGDDDDQINTALNILMSFSAHEEEKAE